MCVCVGFRVLNLGFGVWGEGVQDLGAGVEVGGYIHLPQLLCGLGVSFQGSGFRAHHSGFAMVIRVEGLQGDLAHKKCPPR